MFGYFDNKNRKSDHFLNYFNQNHHKNIKTNKLEQNQHQFLIAVKLSFLIDKEIVQLLIY